MRTRKLLLKAEEISKLIGKVEQRGYTLVPLNLHYKNGRIKLDFALGRGKALRQARHLAREGLAARERALDEARHAPQGQLVCCPVGTSA